jgi:hypothetical protein
MNKKLLLKVADAIKKHPTQFQMGCYFSCYLELPRSPEAGGCGTAACIAGWTCHVALGKLETLANTCKQMEVVAGREASRLLQITHDERERLFLANRWPEPFASRFYEAKSSAQQAKAAIARIKHFIKTEGRE